MEIARKVVRLDVGPIEEDLRRNTDLTLRTLMDLPKLGRPLRLSLRVRRREYASRYADQFTVRLSRPSGVTTEMGKLRSGFGDLTVYGFESEPGSDRMHPWFLANAEMLRDYINRGGYYEVKDNKDGSSQLAAVYLGDMPLGFILDSAGLPLLDANRIWERCRKCWWWKADGGVVVPTADLGHSPLGMHLTEPPDAIAGVGRYCLACGFWWRSGWVMSTTAPRVQV
jgi:hypothetical protein